MTFFFLFSSFYHCVSTPLVSAYGAFLLRARSGHKKKWKRAEFAENSVIAHRCACVAYKINNIIFVTRARPVTTFRDDIVMIVYCDLRLKNYEIRIHSSLCFLSGVERGIGNTKTALKLLSLRHFQRKRGRFKISRKVTSRSLCVSFFRRAP